MEVLTGFESTGIWGSGRDVFDTTDHWRRFKEDLFLVERTGVRTIRYPLLWHKIERTRGVYDWSWHDAALNYIRELGLKPILDPLHHTSCSPVLDKGFLDPNFVTAYTEFFQRALNRYPWVEDWTPINEPYATAILSGLTGNWHPYGRDEATFSRILVNFAQAFCVVSREIRNRGKRVIHMDACENHTGFGLAGEAKAIRENDRRFIFVELVLGRLDPAHPNYQFFAKLVEEGVLSDNRLGWIRAHPGVIDEFGLDYYAHSEIEWEDLAENPSGVHRIKVRQPIGFAAIAKMYRDHLHLPVILGETNIRGRISDRISWLKFMVGECEKAGIKKFCWFPFLDSTDWDSLLARADGHIDPQGILWLEEEGRTLHRRTSELSTIFSQLARREIGAQDIPAYQFLPPVDGWLENFLPLMGDWDWLVPKV